jgi:hypothetical protein
MVKIKVYMSMQGYSTAAASASDPILLTSNLQKSRRLRFGLLFSAAYDDGLFSDRMVSVI